MITRPSLLRAARPIVWMSEVLPRRKRRGEVDALADVDAGELERMIIEREQEMFVAAEDLRFELAARLRDEVGELKKELRGMRSAGHA